MRGSGFINVKGGKFMILEKSEEFYEHPYGREKFSESDLMKMDTVTLRALIRQCAHTIDSGLQRYCLRPEVSRKVPDRARNLLRECLRVWDKRGYQRNKADIIYAYDATRRGDEFAQTLTYRPSPAPAPFCESDSRALEKAIQDRRSIRLFSDRAVPDELLDKVLGAAMWAPNTCSLSGVRFVVLKKEENRNLIVQVWRAPVIIVGGFDERPYRFVKDNELPYNPMLDVGAAIQNMLLTAHALGLGAAWATFMGELSTIRRELAVPDYIKLITYVVMGWPADNPSTVPRMEVGEVVYRETCSGGA